MEDLAIKFETVRRALDEIPRRALAIGGIVLVILALLSSLMVFRGTSKPVAQPFNIAVLTRPRSEVTALRAAAQRAASAQHCVEIAVETTRAQHREIPLHKLLCTDPNGAVSVLAIATFTTKRQAVSVIGSGRLADYDASALFRTIERAGSSARRPEPRKAAVAKKNKTFAVSGTTISIENLSTADCPGAVKAEKEDKMARLMIANQSSRPIDVDQVDANGDHTRYASIPATLSLNIPTYANQPWVLSANSTCLTVAITRAGAGKITLK